MLLDRKEIGRERSRKEEEEERGIKRGGDKTEADMYDSLGTSVHK